MTNKTTQAAHLHSQAAAMQERQRNDFHKRRRHAVNAALTRRQWARQAAMDARCMEETVKNAHNTN